MSLSSYSCTLALNFWRNVNNFTNGWGWVEDDNDTSPCYYCFSVAESSDCQHSRLPLLHYLLELAEIHIHWLDDTIQLSHPLLSSSPLALKSFPASGSFPLRQLFASGGQSIGALASVLPVNIQCWFPLGLTSLISLLSKGLKSLLQNYNSKASIFQHSAFFMVQVSCPYMTTWNVFLGWKVAFYAAAFLLYQICKVFVICRRTPLVGVGADR